MPQPSSYQLLKDIHDVTASLEKKFDDRITAAEDHIDRVESKTDNMLGKIGVGIMVISALISGVISLICNWFKDRL